MTDAMEKLASTGLLGVLLVLSLGTIYYLFKKYSEEKDARIKDGQETQKLLMQMQSQVIEAMHKLAEIVEWVEKRVDEAPKDNRRRP